MTAFNSELIFFKIDSGNYAAIFSPVSQVSLFCEVPDRNDPEMVRPLC